MNSFKKTWWIFALQGLFLMALGASAIFVKAFDLPTLIQYLGLVLIVFGAVLIFTGRRFKIQAAQKTWLIIYGILELGAGILIISYPSDATEIFGYIIGGWAVLMGIIQYVMALRNKNGKLFLVNGSLSLAFGLLIIYNPFKDEQALTYLVGFYSLILGIFVIYYAFKLGRNKKIKTTEQTEVNAHQNIEREPGETDEYLK